MALTNIAAARVVDAIDGSMATYNSNPLKNKVVHADIRVQGIEDDLGVHNQDETGVQLVEQPTPSPEDIEDQERAEQMQTWWNAEMKKHMNQPDGYAKVAVLLIKWADDLDELETRKETDELNELFRDRFHYQTKIVELNVQKKPQHQLNSHVTDFIRDHDGPHSLLIVYYTGHGNYYEDKRFLELTACNNPTKCKGFIRDAKANWNKAEDKLKDEEVEGDVLTILDTCYASNLVKKSGKLEPKKFELIAASPINQTTEAPGAYSFTRALIDGLKEFLDERKDPISTFSLVQRINVNKNRSETSAHVWARNETTDQHILLAPLKPFKPDITQPSTFRSVPGGYLTVRFGLRDSHLNKEQIEYMTKTLSHALFNKKLLGLTKLEWLGMAAAPPRPHLDRIALVMYAVTQWKKVINKRKQDRESQMYPQEMDLSPSTSQKRALEDTEELPDAKRQYLDVTQPPSPPVSNSSRIEY